MRSLEDDNDTIYLVEGAKRDRWRYSSSWSYESSLYTHLDREGTRNTAEQNSSGRDDEWKLHGGLVWWWSEVMNEQWQIMRGVVHVLVDRGGPCRLSVVERWKIWRSLKTINASRSERMTQCKSYVRSCNHPSSPYRHFHRSKSAMETTSSRPSST